MKIRLGNKELEFEKPVSGFDLVQGKEDNVLALKVNGELKDLSTTITTATTVVPVTFDDKEGKQLFWHSSSHILAAAVKKLFPEAKLAIGPAVDNGFYYDIDCEHQFQPDDLKKLEKEMESIVHQKLQFERTENSREEALEICKDEPYKMELIKDLPSDQKKVSFYKIGNFTDLCKGPHVPTTRHVKAIKLTKLAGAYWKGDSKNKQLQRIYGISFPSKEKLKEYLHILEEAEKRDHRKLAKQLKLFSIHDEGPGFPFWHPKGLFIFNRLIEFWRDEHRKAGYVEVKTPILLNRKLWETSGHWFNYKENMYTTSIDNEDYAIKPMNCPGGMLMYKEDVHSYKELPMRVGEIGLVHRHELSGVLSGLFRVRQFHQDDAHIFMTKEQIKDEIFGVIQLAEKFYHLFGLEYHMELSTRPEKSVGTAEQWEEATTSLKEALDATGKGYKINEGDGAFYGPKIDFHIKDALGRTWQCGTVQLDMSQPDRFDLTYMGEDGQNNHRPVMIHRVIYGSLERFIGILIEHYAGKFPLWLSPVQVKMLTVADRFNDHAGRIAALYEENGIRVECDFRNESISKKVREAQLQKINYILVIGEQELESGTVNVRTRDNEVRGAIKTEEFLRELLEEVKSKGSK